MHHCLRGDGRPCSKQRVDDVETLADIVERIGA